MLRPIILVFVFAIECVVERGAEAVDGIGDQDAELEREIIDLRDRDDRRASLVVDLDGDSYSWWFLPPKRPSLLSLVRAHVFVSPVELHPDPSQR